VGLVTVVSAVLGAVAGAAGASAGGIGATGGVGSAGASEDGQPARAKAKIIVPITLRILLFLFVK